jgi:prophage tail gpP-like protein
MSLAIQLNGAVYTSFIAARVIRSIDSLTGAFSFTSTATSSDLFPVRVGDTVVILADGIAALTGYVERLTVDYGVDDHVIEVSGRGVLADLIDSTVKTTKEFTGGVLLESIATAVLSDLGIASSVINNAGTIDVYAEEDIISADVGQSAFDFLELYARKRQVLLNEDAAGNLVLSRGTTDRSPVNIVNLKNNTGANNVKAARLDLNYSNRYNQYVVRSQLNPVFQAIGVTPDLVADQSGTSTDTSIRSTRYIEINAEESSSSTDAVSTAVWEANIRRARSLNYSATLQGHSFNGNLLYPNMLITVRDNFCDIEADLLIRSVTYNYNLDEGSTATVDCAPKDAYTLEAEQNQRDANTTDQAEGLIL